MKKLGIVALSTALWATSVLPSIAFPAKSTAVGDFSTSGTVGSSCVITANSTNLLISKSWPCTPTAHSFVIPAIGSSVTISLQFLNVSLFVNQPLTITDGTNSIDGTVATTVTNGTSISFLVTGIHTGAAGNTMALGAVITQGGYANASTVTNISGNSVTGTVTQTITPPTTAVIYQVLAISPGSGGGGGGSGAAAGGGGAGGSGAALPSPLIFDIAQLLASYGSTSIVVSIPPSGGGGAGGNAGSGSPGTSANPVTITCNGTQIFITGPLVVAGGGAGGTTAAGGTGGSFTNISGFNAINGGNGSTTTGSNGGLNGLTGVSGGGGGGGVAGTGGLGAAGQESFFGNVTGTPAATNGISVPVNLYGGGKGGGGGSAGSINGGNGGNYGSGGGGGAAVTSGTAGSGGNGGVGFVSVRTQ